MRFDPAVADVVARSGAAVVLMHMRGTDPRTMQNDLAYAEPIAEIAVHLRDAASRAEAAGMARARIAIDPGLGFGKSASHSLLLVARIRAFAALGFPLVVGASRKGFTARFSGVPSDAPPRQRLAGSLACAAAAAERGAAVLRVHDVAETARFLAALRGGTPAPEAAEAAGASPDAFATMAAAIRRAERNAPGSGG
jgi:dihydropteroate synthase